jgi:hypothetical protein
MTLSNAIHKFSLNLDNRYFISKPKMLLAISGSFAFLAFIAKSNRTISCAFALGSALIGLGTLYKWKHICTLIAHDELNIPFYPSLNHDNAFRENNHGPATLAYKKLDFGQKIPVMNLQEVPGSFCIGYHQGMLLGENIWKLSRQVLPLMHYVITHKHNDPSQNGLKCPLEDLTLLVDTSDELQGICTGVEDWGDKYGISIDKKELHYLLRKSHLLRDAYKAIGSSSTIVCKDPANGQLLVARSIEWMSVGTIGQQLYSMLYNVDLGDEKLTIWSHTFPGFIGCITCANSKGLYAFVNELGNTSRGNGTPYSFLVKQIIETCTTVDEAEKKIIELQKYDGSFSSFSLTLVDNAAAAVFHFYPGGMTNELKSIAWNEDGASDQQDYELVSIVNGVFKRSLPIDGTPLIVTNHVSVKAGTYVDQSLSSKTSKKRHDAIRQTFSTTEDLEMAQRIVKMLHSATEKNTIGIYLFDVSAKTVAIGCDNYNAGQLIPKVQSGSIF